MRKVDLKMNENTKYTVIKNLVETKGNKKRAAITLGCTVRHINRMIAGYMLQGKAFFTHGNRGKKPAHAFKDEVKSQIVELYSTKYCDANITHYSELLLKHEGIKAAPSTIRKLLLEKNIISPKAKRKTKKNLKKKLKELKNSKTSKKELTKIDNMILNIEDAHPRRPRCAYTGELLQMDASVHLWFGEQKTHLHIAIDDATGAIMGAYFDTQETLKGYYNVLFQILTTYGIPYKFLTDRRTIFEYKQKKSPSVEEDTFTQFGYACKQLGIEIEANSVAQAKGRVERVFQTLQSRLIVEMRLAGISTIEAANEFLNTYIKEFNAKFALQFDNTKSVFETQPSIEKMNQILAVLSTRKIDNGSCIKFQNEYYIPTNKEGTAVHYHKGASGIVIQAFNDELYFSINENVYALELIPNHALASKNFDLVPTPKKKKKKYIPSMNYPWKKASFDAYCNKQKHRNKNIA